MKWIFLQSPVVDLYLPPSITVLCETTFTITAIAAGNASVIWTQVSGAPATIISPNSLSTQINIGNSPGPFKFRITTPQLYKEIEVLTVPISYLYSGGFNQSSNLGIVTNFDVIPKPLESAYVINQSTTVAVKWNLSINVGLAYQYEFYIHDNGAYILDAVITGDPKYYLLKVGKTYVIKTIFNTPVRKLEQTSLPYTFPTSNDAYADNALYLGGAIVSNTADYYTISSSYNKINLGAITQEGLDNLILGGSNIYPSGYTRVTFGAITSNINDPIYSGGTNVYPPSYTRVTYGGITVG